MLTYEFSDDICRGASHYIDGLFFGSACNIFTVMMIYKFWDMITVDDLEFSVANVEHGVTAFGGDDEKRGSTILAKADHHRAYDCLCLLCLVQVYYVTYICHTCLLIIC